MATTTPAWETIKENSAPLERGRNVYALEQFVMETDEERDSKQRMVQTFELRVAPEKSSTFEDPLVDWLSYIKFHQDAYPAATHDQFLLLERCFRTFHKNKRYFNDVRFIRVCCLYADKTAEPCATFKELYKLGIGHASATFWNAWAFVAEKQEDFKLAEQIFEKGLRKQAEPIDYLKLRQKRFQRRMGRYWLNSMRQNDDEEDVRRSVLGSLSSASTVHRHSGRGGAAGRTFQTGAASLSTFVDRSASNNGSTVKAPFPIFSDSENTLCSNFLEDSSDIPTDREREVEAERWKENCATAERWNERGALISNTYNCPLSSIARSTTAHSAFAIHVDEECAVHHVREEHERQLHAASQRRARDERTAVFREHEASVAETLSLDPLRYVRHPEQADQDSKRRRAPESSQKMVMRFVGKQRLLTDNGVEQCFEEARASTGFYTLLTASSNFNYFVKQQENFNDSFASVYSAEFASDDEKTFGSSAAKDETKLLKRKAFATREQREAAKLRHITGKPPTLSCRKPPVAVSTSLHMHNNTSFESVIPTPRNVSTVSSTIDEAVAVGVPTGKEEQTINTQVALKELSMMFSSPALDLNGGTGIRTGSFGSILNKSASSDLGNTSAVMDGIVENVESDTSSDPNSSFAAQDDDNENDRAVRNPDARSNKTSGFEQMALRKLSQESKGQEGRDLECVAHRRIGRISQDDRFRALAENDLPTNPGFSIYNEDDEEGKEPEPSGFPIFKNADYGGYESLQPRVASAFQKDRNVFTTSVCRQSHRAKDLALSLHRASDDTNEGSVASHRKPAFQIFRDDDDKGVRSQVGNWKFSSTSGVLQISADVSDEVCENYHFHDGGTATIVVAGEVIQDSDKATKVLQQANPLEGIGVRELSQEFRNRNHAHKNRDDGVTATFSLIGELNHALEDNITESATRTASTSDRLALFHSYEKGGRAVSPTFLGGNEGRASDYSRDETTETGKQWLQLCREVRFIFSTESC